MKQKIRSKVFETNSSSVHSIAISKEGREPSELKLDKEGMIKVALGSFGKDKEYYTSQYSKLSYLISCLYYISGCNISGIYHNYEFRRIEDAVCCYTGAKGIKILDDIVPDIDHQSIPDYTIEIIDTRDEDAIINFIFNKYVALKTDCD